MTATTSVIIPVRNGAQFIAEAVNSVLSQAGTDDRIFVVDDASTDGTRAVLSSISDPRIAILDGTGRGVSSARNIGLKAACGDFVAFLDHDDTWPAGRHEALSHELLAHPEYDAVFGRVRMRIEPGVPPAIQTAGLEGQHLARFAIWTGLYRQRLLERVGDFAEDMQFGEDTDFSLRLIEAGMRWHLCDIDSLMHRRHAANTSNDIASVFKGQLEVLARKIARARARKAGE